MSKRMLLAVAVGALAIGLLALWLAPASSQPTPRAVTIKLFDSDKTGFEKDVHEAPKGFGAGDWGVFRDPQLNPGTCKKAGSVSGRFALVKRLGKQNGAFLADVMFKLPKGKLAAYFSANFSQFETGFTGAVTGGTDAFQNVSGQITGKQVHRCGDPGTLFTLDLSLR